MHHQNCYKVLSSELSCCINPDFSTLSYLIKQLWHHHNKVQFPRHVPGTHIPACLSYTSPMGALSCQNGSNISFRHISPCTGLAYDARINAADQYSVTIWLHCRMVAAKFGLCTMSNTCSLRHPSFLLHSFSLCCLCAMPLEHSPRLLLGFGNIIPHCSCSI